MIEYGTNKSWMWHVATGELRFQVSQDDKQILCRVTHECIADHCGNPIGEDACLLCNISTVRANENAGLPGQGVQCGAPCR